MHDGSLETLEDVVEFYDAGGRPNPSLDEEIRALRLTLQEKSGLVAFPQSLSGEVQEGFR
jgi:cytochrome c peroxidase